MKTLKEKYVYQFGGLAQGDPKKKVTYRRDADGYLTPVDFQEFHEEGGDSLGMSTDAFLAGIAAVESSSFAENKDDLMRIFREKSDLRSKAGSSAAGATQVIPGYFPGEETQADQYNFMTRRVDEGVAGEVSLREQAGRNYKRYESEIAPQVWNQLGLTPEDFMAGFHFAGSGKFRNYMAALREGRMTPQEFMDSKPTSGNLTMGEYLNRFRQGALNYKD
jgi:hypothetical protein